MRCLILVFVCVSFLYTNLFSQKSKGFLGKTNEFSFDVSTALYSGLYQFHYKKVFGVKNALEIKFGKLKDSGDIASGFKFILIPKYPKEKIGIYDVSGYNFGVSFLSRASRRVEMPFGIYSGIGYEFLKSSAVVTYMNSRIKTEIHSFDNNQSITRITDSFKQGLKQHRLNFIIGRDVYITNNITLDLSVNIGIAFGSIFSEEEFEGGYDQINVTRETGTEHLPVNLYPSRGSFVYYITSKIKKEEEFQTDLNGIYFDVFIFPVLKLGFIF